MHRNAASWTDEEDQALWHLFSQGVSRMRMSVRLRRTERAIQVRLALLRKKHGDRAPLQQGEQGRHASG